MEPQNQGHYNGTDNQWQSYIDEQGVSYFAHNSTGEVYYPENQYDAPGMMAEQSVEQDSNIYHDESYADNMYGGNQSLEDVVGWMERGRVMGPMMAGAALTSMDFDINHELLWVGNHEGLLQSYDLTV